MLVDLYKEVKRLSQQFLNAMAALKELAALAAIFVGFYLLCGLMMYPSPDAQHGIKGTSEGAVVFVDLHARTMQLLYLMIGAVNYPDVMLPAYIEDGTIALAYFVSARCSTACLSRLSLRFRVRFRVSLTKPFGCDRRAPSQFSSYSSS